MIVKNKDTKEWRGILIDWDMCLLVDERDKHHEIRTGRTVGFPALSLSLDIDANGFPSGHLGLYICQTSARKTI